VACSFIALAAWVRQLPFGLLNSCVVTECLHLTYAQNSAVWGIVC